MSDKQAYTSPFGYRGVTKREMALGALRNHTYRGDYSEIRYINNDDIVSFNVINRKSDFNWEFCINGDTSQKIWFSQLNCLYLYYEGNNIFCSTITSLDGTIKQIFQMTPNDFWNHVKGKKFKVKTLTGYYAIDIWNSKCQGRSYKDVVDEIFLKLDREDYGAIEGMTKPMTLYLFQQI